MSNFDMDDPLGDLLSEGSNDSFFEEPKVLAKKVSLTKTPEKKALSDLFGLTDDTKKDAKTKKEDDWLGLHEDTPITKEPLEKSISKPSVNKPIKKISFDDDDDNDIFSSLGIEKKEGNKSVLEEQRLAKAEGKKASLMESILGPSKPAEKVTTSFDDILKESKAAKIDVLKPEPQKTEQQKFGVSSLDAPREGRRGRSQAPNIMDPLGLFTSEQKSRVSEPEIKKTEIQVSPARRRETLPSKTPEWLGLSKKDTEVQINRGDSDIGVKTEVLYTAPPTNEDMKTKSAPNLTNLPDWLGGTGSPMRAHKSDVGINNIGVNEPEKPPTAQQHQIPNIADLQQKQIDPLNAPLLQTLVAQQKLATSHLEYQNTALAMQQQESQLMVALQLKKYEENLADLQRQQQEVLIKQEQQFNNLLERQFAKQQIMENNMKLQQERINSHIQLLISQPPVGGTTAAANEEGDKVADLRKSNAEEITRLYEQIIASLKQHQHEESFLLEESYKKQIATLENTSESVEARLKAEIDHLTEKHKEQLEQMKKEYDEEIKKYKGKMEELDELHKNEIKKIRDSQNTMIEEIKYEYNTMMENVKQTKNAEGALFENANVYSQKLDVSLKLLDINSRALIDIREKVDKDHSMLNLAREETIKAREEEIMLMREALEKARDAAETERSQLMGLVRVLETKLAEQNQNAREERWALQQATATLTAKAAALDREAEYTRAALEQERAQIKTFKENLLAEQERLLLQLTEEKLAVSAEKSRLDTLSKLQNNYDAQKARAEIDAAVNAAREATEQTYQERELLQRQHYDLESMRRQLEDKERKLLAKEQSLENVSKVAEKKALEGEKALMEAKNMEMTYNRQLKGIQHQLASLSMREKRLAEEKIALSKERLALHSATRFGKKCSLCNVEKASIFDEDAYNPEEVEQDIPQFLNVADPELLRLRFEIDNENTTLSNNAQEV